MHDADLPPALRATLTAMYAQPHRHYHTLAHVIALQRWLAQWRHLAREPHLIDAAIWFHDAVYDTQRRDNEECSAALARVELAALGWAPAGVERVAALVLATKDHRAAADDTDARLFLDLDLSVLAQDDAVYDHYAASVRAEYAWVEAALYRSGRAAVLRGFMARPQIYLTPELHAAWEDAAQANLARELGTLIKPPA